MNPPPSRAALQQYQALVHEIATSWDGRSSLSRETIQQIIAAVGKRKIDFSEDCDVERQIIANRRSRNPKG